MAMASSQQSFVTNGHTTKFFLGSGWIPSCLVSRVVSFSFCLFLWVLSNHCQGLKSLSLKFHDLLKNNSAKAIMVALIWVHP